MVNVAYKTTTEREDFTKTGKGAPCINGKDDSYPKEIILDCGSTFNLISYEFIQSISNYD